jgi:nucleotide-binding universal stress UspA family protein
VVTVVSDSPASVAALERAAEEATRRSAPLHVVDACPSGGFKERLTRKPGSPDTENIATALSILTRPDVDVQVVDGPDPHGLVEYCSDVKASTLVVDLGCLEQLLTSDRLLGSLIHEINQVCDLLILLEDEDELS